MKNTPIVLIALLFTFVGGAATGYLLAPPRAPVQGAQHNQACSEPHNEAGVKSGPPVQAETPKAVETRPAASGQESEASPKSLREILEAFSVALPPKGNGKITGIVKRRDGSPLPEVRIRAQGYEPSARGSRQLQNEPGIEEEVTSLIKRRKYERSTRVETLTDAAGCFVLDGLSDIDYYVSGTKRGYVIFARGGAVRPDTHLELQAQVQIELVAEVFGPDGTRRNTASISRSRKTVEGEHFEGSGHRMAGPEFYLYLEPGTWSLVATDPNLPELQSDPVIVELKEGVEPERIALHLIERNTIKGSVSYEGSPPADRIEVACLPANEAAPAPGRAAEPGRRMRRRDEKSVSLWRNDKQDYSFTNLPAGKYELQARIDGEVAASAIVQVTQGVVTQNLVIPAPKRADYVRVLAYGPDGSQLKDLSFGVKYENDGSSSSRGSSRVILQQDGSYWVAHHPANDSKDKSTARYFVSVTSEKFGSKEVEYPKTDHSEVTVRFSVPATLTVTVLDIGNCTFRDSLRVDLSTNKDNRPVFVQDAHDPDGNGKDGIWTFKALEPGTTHIRLLLSFGESAWDWRVIATQEVTLASGANAVSIAIPVLHALKVRTGEAKANVVMTLQPDSKGTPWSTRKNTDANGEVTFEGLSAGSYRIRRGSEQMQVSVPETLDVLFTPVVLNALLVTLEKEDGYGARAGFMTGDLIISANGIDFRNERHIQSTIQSLIVEPSVKLGVLRNGSGLTFEVDPAKFFKSEGGIDFKAVAR